MEMIRSVRLRMALGHRGRKVGICILPTVDSTNLCLKKRAREGTVSAPYLLVAHQQTAGRGRLGRQFISPPGTGLYMSLLIKPKEKEEGLRVTMLAAVAVCRAIEKLTPYEPGIKWVNDLFVKGRKICGILAEAVEDQIIVGIGVNLLTPPGGFPKEAGLAGALDCAVDREKLAAQITKNLLQGLEALSGPEIAEQYRKRMLLTGKTISFEQAGEKREGRVLSIDDDGGLMVETAGGRETLRYGEVTIGSQNAGPLL